MKRAKRRIAGLMAVVLCLCLLSACGEETPSKPEETVLSVGYTSFGGKYSPFYAESPSDRDVVAMTQLPLLSADRAGNVILNGIRGETVTYNGTPYSYTGPANVMVINAQDGTVTYEFTLREDLCFSDGTPLTADDAIFSMYVLCDPMYRGPSDFASLPIKGLADYRKGMVPKWQLILRDTPKNAAVGSASGQYTAAEAQSFWTTFNSVGTEFAQFVIDDLIADGEAEDIYTAAAAVGYSELPEGAAAVDLFHAIVDRCGYDLKAIDAVQRTRSFEELLMLGLQPSLFAGVAVSEGADEITGIQKTGRYSFRVVLTKADTAALKEFCFYIAPMHYYGDKALYSDQEKTFGFRKGDLTSVIAKTAVPLGGGAYRFIRHSDGIVSFAANEYYYRGEPHTEKVLFKKITETQKVERLTEGTIDLAVVDMSSKAVSAIEKSNGGVLGGDVLLTKAVENGGYGCIGISSDGVKVGDDPASEQSKYLRKAFATIFMYYRSVSLQRHYGEGAAVARYPFAENEVLPTDIRGNVLRLDRAESAEERLEIVMAAVLEYLQAAGYTVRDGKVVQAPVGASLHYDLWFSDGGTLESPAYLIFAYTRNAFENIGMTLTLYNRVNQGEVEEAIRNERARLWYIERDAESETDAYAAFFSGDSGHPAGGSNYYTEIADEALDRLLLQARGEEDPQKRKAVYKQCYDIVMDWGTEIPVCSLERAVVLRTGKVDDTTLAQDLTPSYSWLREVESLKVIE